MVKFVWVKGHASVPENERCDQLAVAAYKSGVFEIDEGYENSAQDENSNELF